MLKISFTFVMKYSEPEQVDTSIVGAIKFNAFFVQWKHWIQYPQAHKAQKRGPAEEFSDQFPDTYDAIINQHYVDNYLDS
jgi:hypothetical protein